jgi:hypothetical protein
MESNDQAGVVLAQPKTLAERLQAAADFCTAREVSMPVLVDSLANDVAETYSAFPDRLYVIDGEGRVAYKGGRGPVGFDPEGMERALLLVLLDEGRKSK